MLSPTLADILFGPDIYAFLVLCLMAAACGTAVSLVNVTVLLIQAQM